MTGGTRRRRRRIAVVTGTRADYGLLRSTMEAIDRHANLSLDVVAAGMHLLPKFGRTVDEIVRDGWRVAALFGSCLVFAIRWRMDYCAGQL